MPAAFWVTMETGSSACAYVDSEADARALAEHAAGTANGGPKVRSVQTLPYPARPRLDGVEGWGDKQCPSFCYDPKGCAGRTACPKSYSCVE